MKRCPKEGYNFLWDINRNYTWETIESLGSYQIINQFSTVMKIQNKILNFFYSIILFSIVEKENIMKRLEKIHYEKGSTNPLSVSTLKEAFDPGYNYYINACLLYTSPSPRDRQKSRMPSSA